MAGLLAFTDKVISRETREQIMEVLMMTQVGKMLFDNGVEKGRHEGILEGRREGHAAGQREMARKMALEMLKGNEPKEKILHYSGLNEQELLELMKE